MVPIIPLLAIAAAGVYFLTRKNAPPSGVAPAPQGGGVVPAGTGQAWRTLTTDEFEKMYPTAPGQVSGEDMLNGAPPPHGLKSGDGIILLLTSTTPDRYIASNGTVEVADPQASKGFAVVSVLDGPAAGLAFHISTVDESDAYLWEEAAAWDWLATKGRNGPALPHPSVQA